VGQSPLATEYIKTKTQGSGYKGEPKAKPKDLPRAREKRRLQSLQPIHNYRV